MKQVGPQRDCAHSCYLSRNKQQHENTSKWRNQKAHSMEKTGQTTGKRSAMKQDENRRIQVMNFTTHNGKAEARGFQSTGLCRGGTLFQLHIRQNGPTEVLYTTWRTIKSLAPGHKQSGRTMSVASIWNATHAPSIFCLVKSSCNIFEANEKYYYIFFRKGRVRIIFHWRCCTRNFSIDYR